MTTEKIISILEIEKSIHIIRGHRVMLDEDLAKLYGVSTTRLNEQVKRNLNRFPNDFIFQLNNQEVINLMSQFATSSFGWGGRRKNPFAFTEHGTVMLANILNPHFSQGSYCVSGKAHAYCVVLKKCSQRTFSTSPSIFFARLVFMGFSAASLRNLVRNAG